MLICIKLNLFTMILLQIVQCILTITQHDKLVYCELCMAVYCCTWLYISFTELYVVVYYLYNDFCQLDYFNHYIVSDNKCTTQLITTHSGYCRRSRCSEGYTRIESTYHIHQWPPVRQSTTHDLSINEI